MNRAEWYGRYTAAVFELDRSQLGTRNVEAETAIFSRIPSIPQTRIRTVGNLLRYC
jgi:hypothetical protein